MTSPTIDSIFVGQPKKITDDLGTWSSSIYRDQANRPVEVETGGIKGDRVAQPYHGGPDAAVCVHLLDHYFFWNEHYEMSLQAGCVGENFTLADITEDMVCAGDIVRVGTARLQVSGPRVPCANLARRIGRKDWVKLTVRENRTGFYLRILEPGVVQPGDFWTLEERLNPQGHIPALNRAMYLEHDQAFIRLVQTMVGLGDWWKEQALERLEQGSQHWTAEMGE